MIDPVILILLGIALVVGCIIFLKMHPVLALLLATIVVGVLTGEENLKYYARFAGMTTAESASFLEQSVGKRAAVAFGNTASKIGLLIAMASVIGTSLLRSGGADRVVRSALALLGEKRAPAAFLTSGFVLGIPVFFDTVFYLLIPLTKAMTLRTGKNYLFYLVTVIAGAAMAHSLVPPTPGPLFVATEMGVDIGVMILGGLVVGMVTITFGYLYAAWANRKWTIPPRDSGNITRAELQSLMEKDSASLPPLWLALLPIVLPILLISGNTITRVTIENPDTVWMAGLSSIGDSNMALTISAFISLGILAWSVRDREKIKTYMADAMQSAGLIILITSMGGAFGSVLQQTGIGARIQDLATDYQLAILPLAFFVTVLMRTAQGSSTVAMITSVGIIGGIANMGDLPFHPVYLALAIGCGSKPFPWMNDSGFWIACKMAGMTEGETLKTFTAVLGIMGFSGLFVIIVLAKLFPFI